MGNPTISCDVSSEPGVDVICSVPVDVGDGAEDVNPP